MTNAQLFATLEQLRKSGADSLTIDALQLHFSQLAALFELTRANLRVALTPNGRANATYNADIIDRRWAEFEGVDYDALLEFDGD